MKQILLTTALVAFASAPAFAQTAAPTEGQTTTTAPAEMTSPAQGAMTDGGAFLNQSGAATVYGSEFIGKNVYVTEASGWDASIDSVPDDWENIATVEDILMTADGDVRGVLVDVGGFLGIGARSVALDMNAIDIVYDRSADDFYVVFTSNREALEAAPPYDRAADTSTRRDSWDQPRDTGMTGTTAPMTEGGLSDAQPGTVTPEGGMSDGQAPVVTGNDASGVTPAPTDTTAGNTIGTTDTTAGNTMGTTGSMAADGRTAIPPMDGYTDADRTVLTAEDMQDANVYDANNDDIASVSEVVLSADGQIDQVIVDVGGFLGLGAKPVAVSFDDLTLWQNADNTDLRIYLPMTREELEAMPTHEG